MDTRKQKRLGAAPIASFEKSFEDSISSATVTHSSTTSSMTSTGSVITTTIIAAASLESSTTLKALQEHEIPDKRIHTNGDMMMMEPYEHIKKTTTDTVNIKTKTNNGQHQPSIAISKFGSGNISKNDGNNTKRASPMKTTTTAIATVTSTGANATILDGNDNGGQLQAQHQLVTNLTGMSGTFKGATTLTTPSTPRIELSRASSSSHHEEDSRESSPENVFEQVGTGTLQETIGVGFGEEGALELRSSTEELFFMDPEQKKEEQEKLQHQQSKRSSPHIFKFEDHQNYLQQHQRKDSASSEVAALLCISGRTSRISSVGSQGSAVSRLSAVSGVSRSPSPHRMILETSFCGPKPLENVVDGRVSTTIEPPTAELLEQVLLARKHDPTQAVLAEGITVESSPKKKPTSLSNGNAKPPVKSVVKKVERPSAVGIAVAGGGKPVMGAQRRNSKSPGQMVIGKTPSGTEYIRINLKPDHMYNDKGVAPHEKVVEAPNSISPLYTRSSQKKPASLSLGRTVVDENRLTPSASPKPTRHGILTKDPHSSRSPSPAPISVSRKSSFSSLFRLGGKDSPDSPRECSRSRSKSKERQTPQSQNVTPNKQKSVLAIFKPGKRGSNAGADAKSTKSSSPIDAHELQQQIQQMRSKPQTPSSTNTGGGSRPASRLRYYDEPIEGIIHIPLHTPPEEKETRKLLHGIQQLNAEPIRPTPTAITATQLAAAAAALKPVGARKNSGSGSSGSGRSQNVEKIPQIENLDAIYTLPQDDDNKERTWSLEVNKHSSQDSQETAGSEGSCANAFKINLRSTLANVKENAVQENGMPAQAEIHRLPSVESAGETKVIETVAMVNVNITQIQPENEHTKEKRRLLFTTRLGSGSQDQIFSTQFSISKTESQSSQLSEQLQETIVESPEAEVLHRQGTVIRRSEDEVESTKPIKISDVKESKQTVPERRSSTDTSARRQKSISTSEDEKPIVQTTVTAVVMRCKESNEETRRKSRSTSEDDADFGGGVLTQRHSRYLENFDVRKKYHENVPRKPKRQGVSEIKHKESQEEITVTTKEQRDDQKLTKLQQQRKPTLPQPPPPSTAPSPSPPPTAISETCKRSSTPTKPAPRSQSQSPIDNSGRYTPVKPPRSSTPTRRSKVAPTERQSIPSTDEPVESSESERDSAGGSSAATDPKRRHLPRHVGAIEEHESTGLVSQESFDELPYVPTTLPEERAQGVPIIPMKDRTNMELKTCPVERPRSTTPLNPSHLEEYCGIVTPQEQTVELSGSAPVRGEKLRISLPRKDSTKERVQSAKSPRRSSNASGKSWFEFAEEGIRATTGNLERKDSSKKLLQQPEVKAKPKLAPSKATTTTVKTTHTQSTPASGTTTTQRKLSGHWIDFENIPEKRKPPKRITALPKDSVVNTPTGNSRIPSNTAGGQHTSHSQAHMHGHGHGHGHGHQVPQPDVTMDGKIHYNYVKPEDCQCECHETKRDTNSSGDAGAEANGGQMASATSAATEDEAEGVASSKSINSVDLLQQGEDMLPLLDPEILDGIEPSDSSREYSCYTDDEMDVPMRQTSSSRSKSSSSKLDEFPRRDVSHSPRNRKFPDYRK